jgi:uncharacterized membrane protein
VSRKNRQRQIVQTQSAELRIQRAEMQAFAGPLPPPEALERYNQVLPGAAERIIAMAESQHDHRQHLESTVITEGVKAQRLGTILGFVVAMTTILGGMFLMYMGKESTGLASVITALAALVGVFIYGKREEQSDRKKKADALTQAMTVSR